MKKRKGIMLCIPYEERRLTNPKFGWRFPVVVQPKLDGFRCLAQYYNGSWYLTSSTEGLITSCPHIIERLEECGDPLLIYDGELYNHKMSFEEISSQVTRQTPQDKKIEYHIFDIKHQDIYLNRLYLLNERREFESPLHRVTSIPCDNIKEVNEYVEFFIQSHYEGAIIRELNAPYKEGRSTKVMKFKPKKFDRYQIINVFAQESIHGQKKEEIGGFIVKAPDSDEKFPVAAGKLNQEERRFYWKNPPLGKEVIVGYQNLTEKGKLPRFGVTIKVL